MNCFPLNLLMCEMRELDKVFSSVPCISHGLWFCDSFFVEAATKIVPSFKSYILSVKTTVHCIYQWATNLQYIVVITRGH